MKTPRYSPFYLLVFACLITSACETTETSTTPAADVMADGATPSDDGVEADAPGTPEDAPEVPSQWPPTDCDPLVPSYCSLPWPSNLYLKPDAERTTGYALTFGETSLPHNHHGVPIDPTNFYRLDGYGCEVPLLVHFPDIDISDMASETDLAPSFEADASIVWLEEHEGNWRRIPYWVELDAQADDAAKQVLFVRPAVYLNETARQVVAFRHLKTEDGDSIAPSEAFQALRDGDVEDSDTALSPRRVHFESIFEVLQTQGVNRDELVLAWDFVTASGDAMRGRLMHMSEEAFAEVGDKGPELTITNVVSFKAPDAEGELPVDAYAALELEGTFRVPHFMKEETVAGFTGHRMNLGEDGMPEADGWRDARFIARIPHSAVNGAPHGLIEYGHGLLGTARQVRGSFNGKIANDYEMIFFGADMIGMAEEDLGAVVFMLSDLSYFSWLADRLHQGVLEYALLARAMRERLGDVPEVKALGVTIDKESLYYSGISQGGIFGTPVLMASPDMHRGHLGVPGSNYSLLLHRSVDFDAYFEMLKANYPDSVDQSLALMSNQLLWNGTDPANYLRPLLNHPDKHVLLAVAKGDWQVPLVSNEITVRSHMGLVVMKDYGRDIQGEVNGAIQVLEETAYPHTGSGLVLYDHGNPWPPPGNTPPHDDLGDPHGKPRHLAHHSEQLMHFFRTGEIIDVCGGDGCTPD